MKLKKLEVYGFKSFADRTEIDFESGITGIVGPNGSGKSNLSDAVKWALGEQSAKQLRGARMEDVIFNGSERRKPLPWCEVTVVLDNENHTLSMDAAEVALTRRVYRSGVSEVTLNRAPCRMKDIAELLRDTGIGREGYSLIGQGRIDEILSARPEERRAVFEEAAGIVTYRARKAEAERHIEHTRQNLERVTDMLDAMGEQLSALEEQSKTARAYLAAQERLRSLELNAFLTEEDKARARLDALDENMRAIEEAADGLDREAQSSEAQKEADETRLRAIEEQASRLRAEMLERSREFERLEGELDTLRVQSEHARADADRAVKTERELEERAADLDKSISAEKSHGEALAQNLELTNDRRERSERALEAARAEESARSEELEAHKERTLEALSRLSDLRSAGARLSAMRQTLGERIEQISGERAAMAARREQLELEIINAQSSGEAAAIELEQAAAEKARLNQRERETAREAEALRQRLKALSDKARTIETRLSMLRELADAYEGYPNAVRQILRFSKNAAEGGVCGVVADLIHVPEKYETAIEMALGAAMQNIVTEDEQAAKRLIEYLRQGRYGRATFLPLTTVRGRTVNPQERAALSTPGCLGAASELISFEPRYRDIMESLLGRTALAETMDAGLEVMRRCRHSLRAVTLLGDILHPGGSMTGGSAQGRAANLLSRSREIETNAAELTRARADLSVMEEEAKRAANAQARRALEAETLAERTRRAELAAARENARLCAARSALDALAAQEAELNKRAAQAADTLADIENQIARADNPEEPESLDQLALQRETLRLTDLRVNARQAVEELQEALSSIRAELAALERENIAHKRDLARLKTERENCEAARARARLELENSTALGERTEEAKRERETARANTQRAVETLTARLAEADDRRVKARADLDARSQREAALRARQMQLLERAHRAQISRARLEEERKARQDRIWNAYELTYAGALEYRRKDFSYEGAQAQIEECRAEIRSMGTVNARAVEEYQNLKERFDLLGAQRDDLVKAQADLQDIIHGLLLKMHKRFIEQFSLLNGFFGETFAVLFGGGQASLSLQEEANALECGIDVVVQPPGKRAQLLSLLSGGERALTAIAILFAMLKLKPTPFCILDEIDSALDEANVAHFANAMAGYARDTQFVVLTHRKGTMERCQALFGVTMAEKGVSRMVSVRLDEAV
ncbi:MAG: chromosome segregation protein SMC [Oscillospiraceae bacterium]|nr:chromosome segregation protein SMC [Oscillospiraceae bacterium]